MKFRRSILTEISLLGAAGALVLSPFVSNGSANSEKELYQTASSGSNKIQMQTLFPSVDAGWVGFQPIDDIQAPNNTILDTHTVVVLDPGNYELYIDSSPGFEVTNCRSINTTTGEMESNTPACLLMLSGNAYPLHIPFLYLEYEYVIQLTGIARVNPQQYVEFSAIPHLGTDGIPASDKLTVSRGPLSPTRTSTATLTPAPTLTATSSPTPIPSATTVSEHILDLPILDLNAIH